MSVQTTPRTDRNNKKTPRKKECVAGKLLRDLTRRDAEKAREDALLTALQMGMLGR